jgi:hypothetical protein
MNPEREFMSETFHTLAQPITALRAAVELGLRKDAGEAEARRTLKDCLKMLDQLMQDLDILREIASLEGQLRLAPCNGRALLESCVEEMAPVAQSCGVALQLSAEGISAEEAEMQCNRPMLERAIFVLLDSMIACASEGSGIAIALSKHSDGVRMELRPGAPPGRRLELCRKLMQFAGGSGIQFDCRHTSLTFQGDEHRQDAEKTSTA